MNNKKVTSSSRNKKRPTTNNTQVKNSKVKKKKIRIKFGFIAMLVLALSLVGLGIYFILDIRITNIYISGNSYLTDQKIIELACIQNYPSTFKNSSSKIKKRIEKNIYIKEVSITKKSLTQVFITIEENKPLFYNQLTSKTILLNGEEVSERFNVAILNNNIPEAMYDEFIEKMGQINNDVLNKISEISYAPDEVDDERFLFTMTDSNYAYLTLKKVEKINDYNNIVKQFDNKKGILYLNSGGYFEIAK